MIQIKITELYELERAILNEVEARGLSRVAEMSPNLVKDIYNVIKFFHAENCVVAAPFDFFRKARRGA